MDKKTPGFPAQLDTIAVVKATLSGVKIIVTQCSDDEEQYELLVIDADKNTLFKTLKSYDLDDLLARQHSLLRGFAF